jgi:hypothetical protein
LRTRNPNRISLILVFATLALGLVWVGFSKFAVPLLIESAYRGESWPVFNRMISGQASHPLAEYLASWDKLSWNGLFAFFLVGLLIVGIARPEFQAAFWSPTALAHKDSTGFAPIARRRLLLAYAVIAIIVGCSLFDLITDTEHWPFSQYPMYSHTETSHSLTRIRLFGVTRDGIEIPLYDIRYLQPFDNSRLQAALERAAKKNQLSEAARDCLIRYEALRRVGRHNGPQLQSVRVYRVHWVLDPWARNIDHPDRKNLLVEVAQSDKREP